MDLDKGEMLLPRLFQQSETGRGALNDFTTFKLIRPPNQAGLIPWVNDYIPQWKRNELLQMALAHPSLAARDVAAAQHACKDRSRALGVYISTTSYCTKNYNFSASIQ